MLMEYGHYKMTDNTGMVPLAILHYFHVFKFGFCLFIGDVQLACFATKYRENALYLNFAINF